jgi:hypothetical protein
MRINECGIKLWLNNNLLGPSHPGYTQWIKPVQKSQSLEEMIAAQGYTPPAKEVFFSQTVESEWDESLE